MWSNNSCLNYVLKRVKKYQKTNSATRQFYVFWSLGASKPCLTLWFHPYKLYLNIFLVYFWYMFWSFKQMFDVFLVLFCVWWWYIYIYRFYEGCKTKQRSFLKCSKWLGTTLILRVERSPKFAPKSSVCSYAHFALEIEFLSQYCILFLHV